MTYSVVLCTYNPDPEMLLAAINSVLAQSILPNEIVLVDDCSDNCSVGAIMEHIETNVQIKLVRNEKNLGLAKSLIIAMANVNTNIVARIDDDDIWIKGHASRSLAFLTNNQKFGIVCSKATYFNDIQELDVSRSCVKYFNQGRVLGLSDLIWDNPIIHSSVFFRKDIYHIAGGYQTTFRWEDYDLWVRMLTNCRGYQFNCPSVFYRVRANSLSRISKDLALKQRVQISAIVVRTLLMRKDVCIAQKIFALFIFLTLYIRVNMVIR